MHTAKRKKKLNKLWENGKRRKTANAVLYCFCGNDAKRNRKQQHNQLSTPEKKKTSQKRTNNENSSTMRMIEFATIPVKNMTNMRTRVQKGSNL
jgi:hypothetical protein